MTECQCCHYCSPPHYHCFQRQPRCFYGVPVYSWLIGGLHRNRSVLRMCIPHWLFIQFVFTWFFVFTTKPFSICLCCIERGSKVFFKFSFWSFPSFLRDVMNISTFANTCIGSTGKLNYFRTFGNLSNVFGICWMSSFQLIEDSREFSYCMCVRKCFA